jgi:hypothetical protein
MGLDNYPTQYPCRREQTAVLGAGGHIDCRQTQQAGGCPWLRHYEADNPGRRVLGLLGADCWWRGKVSVSHLQTLARGGWPLPEELAEGFYGEVSSEGALSGAHCLQLAEWLATHSEAFAAQLAAEDFDAQEVQDEVEIYRYAIWWLRFVARHGDGAQAWW